MGYNNMGIEIVEVFNPEEWMADLPDFNYSLFITPQWICSMSNEIDTPIFFDFLIKKKSVAKLSGLICNRGKFKGKQLYCYAAPALKEINQTLYDGCFEKLLEYATENKLSRIIIGSYDQQNLLKVKTRKFFASPRNEYVVDLTQDLTSNYSKGFKKNIQKAENYSFEYYEDSSDKKLSDLFNLIENTRKRKAKKYNANYNPFYLSNLNKESIVRLTQTGLGNMHYMNDSDGNTQCVVYNLEFNGKSYGLLMGTSKTAYNFGIPSFLDNSMLKQLKHRGFSYYNVGGAPDDSSGYNLQKYKKSMGGIKRHVYGATTNFLVAPQKALNPLLTLSRMLPTNNFLVKFLKRLIH